MSVLTILLFAFAALIALNGLFRPQQVVVVRDRDNPPGCIGGLVSLILLLLIVIVGLVLLETSAESAPPTAPEKKEESRERVKEGLAPLINQAPPAREREITQRDTFINTAPPRHTASLSQNETMPPPSSEESGNREIYMPKYAKQDVVLVKRFADLELAMRLRKHFSRWGMEVFEVSTGENRYWNCVPVSNPKEGYAKIREWNRHHHDFDHLGLELKVTQIILNSSNF